MFGIRLSRQVAGSFLAHAHGCEYAQTSGDAGGWAHATAPSSTQRASAPHHDSSQQRAEFYLFGSLFGAEAPEAGPGKRRRR